MADDKQGERSVKRRVRIPEYIWADYDQSAERSVRWAFYRTKAEQRGNRPDLNPIKLRVYLA